MNEYVDEYILLRGDKMPSLVDFRIWMRDTYDMRATSLDDYVDVRAELNMYHENWLQNKAAEGGRHSAIFIQMLKQLQDKVSRLKETDAPVSIQLDFSNTGKNSV